MLTLDQSYKHLAGLVWRTVEDGVVIVSPAGGEVRALNQLGSSIWEKLDGSRPLRAILEELQADYPAVSTDNLQSDLFTFVQSLVDRKLLESC